jgi:hypothetical protein
MRTGLRTWIVAGVLVGVMPRPQAGPERAGQVLWPSVAARYNRGRACVIS